MSINDDTKKLLSLISRYAAPCENAEEAAEIVPLWNSIKQEIQTLYQYKEDAEKWRQNVELTALTVMYRGKAEDV
jgi:hypothetical protein